MIPLENEYILRGRKEWKYRVIKRTGDVVLAEVHRLSRLNDENDPLTPKSLQGYEVFVVQKYPERPRPDGQGMIPAKEMPPSDFHWGRYGFSYSGVDLKSGGCLKKAQAMFEVQLKLQDTRVEKRLTVKESKKK